MRGISILGVVATHAELCHTRPAFIGVDIFFVLSGFLITCLLIQEFDRYNTFSLKRFYLRRALRLLPALAAMLATFLALEWCLGRRENAVALTHEAWQAIFYCRNWVSAFSPALSTGSFGHTWSLSIEEQFYLLWPPILLLMLRRTVSRASLFHWVVLAAILSAFVRLVLVFAGAGSLRLYCGTDTRCDALLLGCAGAIALCSGLGPKLAFVAVLRRWLAFVSAAGLIFLAFYSSFQFDVDVVLVYFLISLFALFVVLEVVSSENGLLCRAFSQRWLVYIGKVSYGLYLWHLPIFLRVQSQHWGKPKELAVEFVFTAAVVLASYYFLERPFLRLKEGFSYRSR